MEIYRLLGKVTVKILYNKYMVKANAAVIATETSLHNTYIHICNISNESVIYLLSTPSQNKLQIFVYHAF